MGMTAWKRAAVSLTAVAVIGGVAGCQDGEGSKKAAEAPAKPRPQTQEAVTKVIQAAYRKTSDAKSAKVRMSITMPAAMDGGGTMEMTGVQGWNPAVMDITMKGSLLTAGDPDAPEQSRMIVRDGVMYMDMGAAQAAERNGKRWVKIPQSADGALGQLNQDPAQQLALLLESPNLKHVGAQKVNGVATEHYKGTLTFEQMLDANKAQSGPLSAKERKALVDNVEKMGMKGYDTEVWVDGDGYPVRMVVGMTMDMGTVHLKADYTGYGAAATVQAPPAKDTYDLGEMLKGFTAGEAG